MKTPPGFTSAFGKLEEAVEELVGVGTAKERLSVASALVAPIDPDDFPDPLRAKYVHVYEALTWIPPDEGSVQGTVGATLEAMTEEEAGALAKELLSLYMDAAEILHSRYD